MSRNTVDFDDLLASLDDLSTTNPPPPPPEEEPYYQSEQSAYEEQPSYMTVDETPIEPVYEEPTPPPPPPPAHKPAPVIHKPQQVHRDSSPAPVSGDMKNYQRQSTVGHNKNVGNCHKCGSKIESDYVVAQGKNYHLNHFSCLACSKQLSGAFFEHNGHPHCENCAGNLLPCSRCHRGITGQYIIQDGKPFHKDCSEHWVCAKCGRDVTDTVTTAMGKHFHKHCFSCHQCNTPLGNSFVNKDGKPTCNNCANKGKPGCHVCGREVSGDYVSFDGKSYHKDCFKCGNCNRKLELSGFYQVNGKMVCEGCQRRG